jgi:hypothetical protein
MEKRWGAVWFIALFMLFFAAAPACAESWFSITGDPADPAADTVQVAPDTVVVFTTLRVMKIRANRAVTRAGYDGVPYRSYVSTVQIDCETNEARFRKLELFYGPLWTGPNRVVDYPENEMPKMVFMDLQPNPVERIVQAACVVGKIQTR